MPLKVASTIGKKLTRRITILGANAKFEGDLLQTKTEKEIAEGSKHSPMKQLIGSRITNFESEEARVDAQVKVDRSGYLDSLLMKVMKKERSLTEDALLTECMQKLIFPGLDRKIIRVRLEVMIKRGLLDKVEAEGETPVIIKFTSD